MRTIQTANELQQVLSSLRSEGKTVGLVPTMGNLHDGHLALIDTAKQRSDIVVATIFVNPLQFGPNEDYNTYPRTLEEDLQRLQAAHVDLVYTPCSDEIYPEGNEQHTQVSVKALDGMHCGKSRSRFFTGIATVVMKMFNIVRPETAVFGEKDYQQLAIIRKMVRDMCVPVQVVSAPIVRDSSGLALSSRNRYLTDDQRNRQAPGLYRCLVETRKTILEGERNYTLLQKLAFAELEALGIKPDYFNISNAQTLLPATPEDRQLVILAAGYLGKARLIDNVTIDLDEVSTQ